MLKTWKEKGEFKYVDKSDGDGLVIHYGKTQSNNIHFTSQHMSRMIENFSGQEVCIGTNFTNPEPNTLESWLQESFSKTSVSSYIAVILVDKGLATRTEEDNLLFD